MADWLDFRGVRSTTHGVIVEDYPPVTLSEERAKDEEIPGRSGSLTVREGDAVYDDIVLSFGCRARDLTTIDQISAWIRGSGTLVRGDIPDRSYLARCVNQTELATIIRGRTHRRFPLVFRCQPYRYAYPTPPPQTITSSPGSINNPGTADAYPLITIVGSGDVALTIGAKTLSVESLASQVTYDTETGFALDGSGGDLTPTVSLSEWPLAIKPGINTVSWTGSVTSVTITRPWRYV